MFLSLYNDALSIGAAPDVMFPYLFPPSCYKEVFVNECFFIQCVIGNTCAFSPSANISCIWCIFSNLYPLSIPPLASVTLSVPHSLMLETV